MSSLQMMCGRPDGDVRQGRSCPVLALAVPARVFPFLTLFAVADAGRQGRVRAGKTAPLNICQSHVEYLCPFFQKSFYNELAVMTNIY